MTTSKVAEVVSIKPYNSQNGTVYYHLLKMDNGDKINIGKKKELTVGATLTYEMIETGQQEYNKSKSVQPQNDYRGNKNGVNNVSSFALSYAKDWCLGIHHAGTNQTPEDVIAVAEEFNNWLKQNQ